MSQLDEDVRAARILGYPSYGKYIAAKYEGTAPMAIPPSDPPPQRKKRPRKFSDAEAFRLWQEGMKDAEIAKTLGVSREAIVQWRDQLELPSTWKNPIDTKKYRLAALQDGTPIVVHNDDF